MSGDGIGNSQYRTRRMDAFDPDAQLPVMTNRYQMMLIAPSA